jgi:indole-3-glycerol phosphate synthase
MVMSSKPGLADIVARKRADLSRRKEGIPLSALEKGLPAALPVRDFAAALRRPGRVSLVAELKKASPSAGLLRERYDVAEGARAYARAGAAALSILTEENYFLGALPHLAEAKGACDLPALRKDFVFDPYQVTEARVHGADAVLLIVALLSPAELKDLIRRVETLGMTALVEVHDPEEVRIALDAGARAVGVNSRNLKDLSMDPAAFEKMLPLLPRDRLTVAESGIKTAEDVARLKALGASAMLVGESLLKQPDLERAAETLARAGA